MPDTKETLADRLLAEAKNPDILLNIEHQIEVETKGLQHHLNEIKRMNDVPGLTPSMQEHYQRALSKAIELIKYYQALKTQIQPGIGGISTSAFFLD